MQFRTVRALFVIGAIITGFAAGNHVDQSFISSAIADDTVNVYPPPCPSGTVRITEVGVSSGCYSLGGLGGFGQSPGTGSTHIGGGGGSTNEPNNNTPTTKPSKDKNPRCTNRSGDPIEISKGARTDTLTLFSTPHEMGLAYELFYVSPTGWSDTLSYWLNLNCGQRLKPPPPGGGGGSPPPCLHITFNRPDGSSIVFDGTPGTVGNYPEVGGGGLATLVENSNGTYTLHDENADTLVFTAAGQLQSIIDSSGIGWSIANDSNGRPIKVTHTSGASFTLAYQVTYGFPTITTVTVTDPAGNAYQYAKQGMPNGAAFHGPFQVNSVTFPGSPATTLTYKYATGNQDISDLIETDINGVPYSYGTYDSGYEPTGTRLADGSEAVSIVYAFPTGYDMTATITNSLGHTTVDHYHLINGQFLFTSASDDAVADCGATTHTAAYDSSGNLTKIVDNDGIAHTYSYAANGQLQSETEAYGTAVARTINYAWDSNAQLNRLFSVTVLGESKVSYAYNAQNRLASVTRTNLTGIGTPNQSLTTSYAYTLYGNGMVQTMTVTQPSPNGSDHTTYVYDTHGNLTSVTDGLGYVTTYSNYNALGEVGKVVGPNGDETDYTYDARSRVATKTTHPNGTTATWTYAYDGFGLLAKVSEPDGEIITWSRDAEKRVKTITHNDKDGASTETFTYDANDDVTSDVVARGSDVGKSTSYVYDALGRIYQVKGSHRQVLTYAYDGNGNVLSVTDALGHKTSYAYDALNRLANVTNAAGGVTAYMYDAGDHITHITDPRSLVTGYAWDGLGQLWQQQSPDTGTTIYGFDAYGRLSSFYRADGIVNAYGYDALNRVTSVTAGGITRTYTWDACTNGKDRLCVASNQGYDSVGYSYSPEGWITGRSFTFSGGASYALGYAYDNMGHLSVVGYPDGNEANYYYRNGAVDSVGIQIGSNFGYAASNVSYRPMDLAMSSWTSYYNSSPDVITYDTDLRPTSITMGNAESLTFNYDAANRITQITNGTNGNLSASLGYDALDRLVAYSSPIGNESYAYDADGNRTYQVIAGTATSFSFPATSNRVASTSGGLNGTYGYDANGNTTTVNGLTAYQYGPFNRLINASGASYVVSAEGQRLSKTSGSFGAYYFAPDASGTLLAEDENGSWRDYVWLSGRLVGIVVNGSIFPTHDDQTGRPAAITNPYSYAVLWQSQGLPFNSSVTYNVWGTFNLGFPGQYYDGESGLWHNGYRDYDPTTGRYIESDPIGLAGGINTYAYVGDNPISLIDPLGLCDDHKCNKLERGLAIGAVDANKFADASGNYAKYLGGAAAGGAVVGAVTADPVVVGAAGGAAVSAGGVGMVSEATSVASGFLNTVASGGNFRYLGRAVLTSVVGGMVGTLVDKIPYVGPGLSTTASSYLESHIGSLQPLPPPCDVQ